MGLIKHKCLVYDEDLLGKYQVFEDRIDAGLKLAKICKEFCADANYVFAIPRGGIPIAVQIVKELNVNIDLVNCRKLLIPWNPEAGFGAIDPDGNVYVDEVFASYLGLTDEEIRNAIKAQLDEIKSRERILRRNRPYPNLRGSNIIVVDDGIAAGYTMRAAIGFLKRKGAEKVYVAVPTCHLESALKFCKEVNLVICLNPRSGPFYAVADAYINWRDLTDEDVIEELKKVRYY